MKILRSKKVSESAVNDHAHLLFSNDLNAVGTAFGGRVIEIADRLGATVAQRHAGGLCVLLLMDSVRFLAPAKKGEILIFKAAVNRAWKTSLEVGVKVLAENYTTGGRRHVASAYLTFVRVDKNHRPILVRPIISETEAEKRRYQEADQRRQERKEKR